MERAFYTLRTLRSSVIMSKFGSGYRKKSGNCNKPFRRFREQCSQEEGWSNSGTQAGSSRHTSPRRSDSSGGRSNLLLRGCQGQEGGSAFGSGFRSGRGKAKVTMNYERRFHKGAARMEAEADRSFASGASESRPQKHPTHLKGKEIGLWYADQNKKKKAQEGQGPKDEDIVEVILDSHTQNVIERVLSNVGAPVPETEEELGDMSFTKNLEDSSTFEDKINQAQVMTLQNNEAMNNSLFSELLRKKNSSHYREMCRIREKLPCFKKKQEIIDLIEQNQICVISGGTGCGKTTQIVQYVLDDYILKKKGSLCSIVCTQPRRISAVTVAERVASERDERIGESIGYQIRLETVCSARSRGCINYVTTGILLAWLSSEPILNGTTHLFLDEIHERTIESDLMLALLKYIIPKRPDMKIVLMSATVNAEAFSAYFGGAPSLEIPGFTYPVKEIFLEDILERTRFKFPEMRKPNTDPAFNDYIMPYIRNLEARALYPRLVTEQLKNPLSEEINIQLMAEVIHDISRNEGDGAILVFVPGLSEINNLQKLLNNSPWFSPSRYMVIPMHSILPTVHQKEAFVKPPPGVRKVVIATSIIETSVTIEDVVYVVDCGKNKSSGYDIKQKVATLEPSWISLANAHQRRGRAGRVQPGKCYKLYSKIRQDLFDQYPTPEMQSTSLEGVILKAKLLQLGHVAPFLEKVLDPPDPEMVELSLKVLRNLNALDSDERLTPLGYHLSKLPMDPHTGKMILMGALFSCIDPIFSIAACLSFKDPFMVPLGKEDEVYYVKDLFSEGEKSDHFIYSQALSRWEAQCGWGNKCDFSHHHFLSNYTLNLLSEMKRQFAKILHSMNFLSSSDVKHPTNNVNSENRGLVKAIVCAGLYPNVAFLRKVKKGKTPVAILKTADHKSVRFHMKSYCSRLDWFESPFFVYHLILKSSGIFIHDATMIQPMPLVFFGEKLHIVKRDGTYYIEVDDLIKFKSTNRTGLLIKNLRNRLDWILESAISNPKVFDWESQDEKREILDAIVSLVSLQNLDGRRM